MPIPVLIEPLEGHTDAEVLEVLRVLGAQEVEILAPGFISAQADPDELRWHLRGIGQFQVKPTTRPTQPEEDVLSDDHWAVRMCRGPGGG